MGTGEGEQSNSDRGPGRVADRATPRPRAGRVERRKHRLTRGAFYAHLWLGIVFTIILTAIAITGILLNHKRGLGLMPDVANESDGRLTGSISLDSIARIGLRAAMPGVTPALANVDRMDVRPRDGYAKVRLRDATTTEVTVDLRTGAVLHVGPRGDVFIEKLHSGEIFGSRGILLSDAGAVALLVTLVTGVWLWLAPRREHKASRGAAAHAEGDD